MNGRGHYDGYDPVMDALIRARIAIDEAIAEHACARPERVDRGRPYSSHPYSVSADRGDGGDRPVATAAAERARGLAREIADPTDLANDPAGSLSARRRVVGA